MATEDDPTVQDSKMYYNHAHLINKQLKRLSRMFHFLLLKPGFIIQKADAVNFIDLPM